MTLENKLVSLIAQCPNASTQELWSMAKDNHKYLSFKSVKNALSDLVREGMIKKKHGGNTYRVLMEFNQSEKAPKLDLSQVPPMVYVGIVSGSSIEFRDIIGIVASQFEVTIDQLTSSTRKREISEARMAFFWFAMKYREAQGGAVTLKEIGGAVNRDHATVLHGVKVAKNLIEMDKKYAEKIRQLEYAFNIKENPEEEKKRRQNKRLSFYFEHPNALNVMA